MLSDRMTRVAVSLPFRIVLAVLILALHLAAMTKLGRDRLGYAFNSAPGAAPAFTNPRGNLDRWDRLIVSRWDAEHYMALGVRGYRYCKTKETLRPGESFDDGGACQLHFYPTYGFLGAAVAAATGWPIDYSLLAVSLAASFALILMWTSKEMTSTLGVGGAYLSLLLLNVFSTGYILVTIETEPCLMALSLGSFLCFRKRWLVAGAVAAGAATAIRISGLAVGFAYCAGVLAMTLRESPRRFAAWPRRAGVMALSGWGIMALMGYYAVRFGDPLIYIHSHEQAYQHSVGLLSTLFPDGRVLVQSIWAEPNDGLFVAAALLWFALGHHAALARFRPEERTFWYAFYFLVVGISMVGSVGYAFGGGSRFMIAVLPLFFAMAAVLRRHPAALVLWLYISASHYYNANICFYESQRHPDRLHRCGFARNFRSEDLQSGKALP